MKLRIVSSLILIFFSFGFTEAQPETEEVIELKTRYGFKVIRRNPLNFNAFFDYNPVNGQPILYTSVAIQNDVLQFEKTDDKYKARYRISIAVRTEEKSIVQFSEEFSPTISDFKLTNSTQTFQTHTFKVEDWNDGFSEEPQKYICLLQIQDLITHKIVTRTIEVFAGAEYVNHHTTEICFLNNNPDTASNFPLSPLKNHLNYNKPYYAFAQITPDSSFSDQTLVRLFKDDVLIRDTRLDVISSHNRLRIVFPLGMDSLSQGAYRLEMQAGEKTVHHNFFITWFNKPTYLYKYDLALRPMRYILSEQEYDNAGSMNQRELSSWFNDFWGLRDPSRDTEFNELMAEYFLRVQDANKKFRTRRREGWETDRGKIFILFGPPAKIENGRYAAHSLPYLVWKYADSTEFVFVDKKRNGEFTIAEKPQKE